MLILLVLLPVVPLVPQVILDQVGVRGLAILPEQRNDPGPELVLLFSFGGLALRDLCLLLLGISRIIILAHLFKNLNSNRIRPICIIRSFVVAHIALMVDQLGELVSTKWNPFSTEISLIAQRVFPYKYAGF